MDIWRQHEEPRRQKALQALMAERNLDAVIIIGGVNLSYFSGFAGLERTMARAMIYIAPRGGEPILVAHTFRKHIVEAKSWVRSFAYFTRLSQAPVEAVVEALSRAGLSAGRLGLELGYESQIQMPQAEFERLRASLSDFAFVDIAADLWRIRALRSPLELDRQKAAGALVRDLYADCFGFIKGGMRQAELSHFIQQRMAAHGVPAYYALISAGAENYDFCGAWTPDYIFADGDMVWLDIGVQQAGYSMLFSRAGVIGVPSRDQVETARAVHAATMAGVTAIAPGRPIADIAAICERELNAIEAPVTTNIAELGTRYGHGIGIEFVEPPHVASYDETVLAPGMLVAIEPGIATRYGRFHFREVAIVTDEGFELIPGPPAELVALPLS